MVEFGVLGPLRVHVDEQEVPIAGRRERCVVATLALNVGRVVSTDMLFEHLWGDEPPRTANKALQTAVANVRKVLRDAWPYAHGPTVETHGAGYLLDAPPEWVDAVRFDRLVEIGREALREGSPVTASLNLGGALDLWRGDVPADLGDGVGASVDRERLIEGRLEVLADRVDADLRSGRHREVVAEVAALADLWPTRERFHELLVLALYRSGRQTDALAAYQRLRTTLIDEHGVEPGERLRQLEQRILDQDPMLLAPASDASPGAAVADRPVVPALRRARLIGREAVIGELVEAVIERQLVTLVGPGGVGKTSLADAVAAQLGEDHFLPVVRCTLGSVLSPSSIVPALATVLGVQQRGDVTMLDAVRENLRAAPTLLVIDNCEHLLAGVVDLVADLLGACPTLRILATSRERLATTGEVVWPVDGLSVPSENAAPDELRGCESVQLFLERARDHDPRFTIDNDAMSAIGDICRHLDGLPLAIELAAARVRALPPHEIAKRLDQRFELLGGGRGGLVQHRTLRATVAWSHDLLAERERRLFRRLGTFAGPFTIDAAEAVGALDDLPRAEIASLLADLVDKSMVAVSHDGPAARHRLLETLRAFALEELEQADEIDETNSANLAYHREALSALSIAVAGAGEVEAVTEIEAGFDNIRHAVDVARERGDATSLVGLVGGLASYARYHVRWEVSMWADDALALVAQLREDDRPRVMQVAGLATWGRWFAGDLDSADRLASDALASEDVAGEGGAEVLAARSLSMMYRQDPDAASVVAAALAHTEASGDDWLGSYLLGQLAIMHAYGGSPADSLPLLERQGALAEALDNPSARGWWLYCRAEVSGERDPDETVRLAREGAELARLSRSNLLENICRITALTVAARHGEPDGQLDEFAALIGRFRRDGAWTHVQVVVWNLVEVLDRLGIDESAAVLLHASPPGAPAPYGDQLARLNAVRTRLEERMAADAMSSARRAGASLTRDGVAATALEAVSLASGRRPRRAAGTPGSPADRH